MWMFLCVALIVMMVLALWHEPDRAPAWCCLDDPQVDDLEAATGIRSRCRHRARPARAHVGGRRGVHAAVPATARPVRHAMTQQQ